MGDLEVRFVQRQQVDQKFRVLSKGRIKMTEEPVYVRYVYLTPKGNWKGSLIDWGVELSFSDPPEWYNYAMRHEEAHPGHIIMVEYPTSTVPLRLSIPNLGESQT